MLARRSVHETKASSDQPAIEWEEQALEILYDGAQVGLDGAKIPVFTVGDLTFGDVHSRYAFPLQGARIRP